MASNVTVQSVLGKISHNHLKCSICTNRFMQPKVLKCLHSFCLRCLQKIRHAQDSHSTEMTCPLCRRITTLTRGGLHDLPNDFKTIALLEEVTKQEQLLEGQGSKIKCCQACYEGNQAVSRCMDCDHFLCQECQRAHERTSSLKSHKIFSLAKVQSGLGVTAYKSKSERESSPKCSRHSNENLSIYCNTCQKLICRKCTTRGHAKHYFSTIQMATDKCKQEIEQLLTKAAEKLSELFSTMEEAKTSRKKLDLAYDDTTKKISVVAKKEVDRINEEIAKICEEEQKLKEEAKKIYQDRLKVMESAREIGQEIKKAEQKLNEISSVLNHGSHYEILDLKQTFLHNLTELKEVQIKTIPMELSFLDFEEGDKSLGKLVLQPNPRTYMYHVHNQTQPEKSGPKGKWQMRTEIHYVHKFEKQNTPFERLSGVAVFSNSDIIVVDTECDELIYIVPATPSSPKVSEVLPIDGLFNSSHVAGNKDGQLIVLAGTVVKTFDEQSNQIHCFNAGSVRRRPSCLAVDDNNDIAVGYRREEEIYLYNRYGQFMKNVQAPGINTNLTISNQRFIYTNMTGLSSIDFDGSKIFSIDVCLDDSDCIPSCPGETHRGVCCDKDGSIYVAVQGDTCKMDKIHQYSPNGNYIDCTVKKVGCSLINDMAFTSEGHLVVATDKSVKIYHRV